MCSALDLAINEEKFELLVISTKTRLNVWPQIMPISKILKSRRNVRSLEIFHDEKLSKNDRLIMLLDYDTGN